MGPSPVAKLPRLAPSLAVGLPNSTLRHGTLKSRWTPPPESLALFRCVARRHSTACPYDKLLG